MTRRPRRTPMEHQRSRDGGATGSMRLNPGCGYDRREGYLNVDKRGEIDPRRLADSARRLNNVVREVTVVPRSVKG